MVKKTQSIDGTNPTILAFSHPDLFLPCIYMGETSQEGKRPTNWELTTNIFFALLEIVTCLKHIEASHIMAFNS